MSEAISHLAQNVPATRAFISVAGPQRLPRPDAALDHNSYDRLARDPKYRHFSHIPGRIVRCLDYFQIPVDRSAATQILRAYYLFIGVVDNAIDSGEMDTAQVVFDHLQTLAPINYLAVSDVALTTERLKCHLHQDNHTMVIQKLRELYAMVVDERSVNSIDLYIDKRRDVGCLTAELSYLLIRPMLDREYPRLQRFMHQVGAVGCLVDSVIDLKEDRRRGLLNFKPNIRCHAKLIFSALINGLSITFEHPQLTGLFLQAIADNVRDRFGHRLQKEQGNSAS